MLRRCFVLRTRHANLSNPYKVLGVEHDTPFEEVRRNFQQLTLKYHPDKPEGDAEKFREINTAYRQIRSEYRNSKDSATKAKFDGRRRIPQGSEEFWNERNTKVRMEQERIRRRQQQDREERDRRSTRKRKSMASAALSFLNGYEIIISICLVVVVLIYSIERYFTVNRLLTAKNERIKRMDEGLPPPMPLEEQDQFKGKFLDRPEVTDLQTDALRIKQESFHRRATQRKFDDFREYIFVVDPEGVADRKVTTQRFSHQYLNEKEIPKKCPILIRINSEVKQYNYESAEAELVNKIESTPWVNPDMAYAGSLVAKGLSRIAVNSPTTTKWTFIEYSDTTKGKSVTESVCLAAILNNRFEKIGMCQRVSISGRVGLRPELDQQRLEDIKSGKVKKRKLVNGGTLKVKELSTQLKDMRL